LKRQFDTGEFKDLFDRYFVPLLRYGATMIKEEEEAKDIVQQAFIRLWDQQVEIANARAWLYKTVHNASLDYRKHEQIKEKHVRETMFLHREEVAKDNSQASGLKEKIAQAMAALLGECGKLFRMIQKFKISQDSFRLRSARDYIVLSA
jgi:RNA polymerase sigma-70 factor (ECF subfamily)